MKYDTDKLVAIVERSVMPSDDKEIIRNTMTDLKTQLAKAKAEIVSLKASAVLDKLTGVYNQTGLELAVEKIAKTAEREGGVSFMMVDLDDFKYVDDTYGHNEGDRVLKSLAKRMEESLRPYDMVVRRAKAGDEFVLVAPCASKSDAYDIAKRIRRDIGRDPKCVAKDRTGRFKDYPVTVSIGMTWSKGVELIGDMAEEERLERMYTILDQADRAMYRAKKHMGKDSVAVHGEIPTRGFWEYVVRTFKKVLYYRTNRRRSAYKAAA